MSNETEQQVERLVSFIANSLRERFRYSLLNVNDNDIRSAIRCGVSHARFEAATLEDVALKQHQMLRAFRHSMDTEKPFPSSDKLNSIIDEYVAILAARDRKAPNAK